MTKPDANGNARRAVPSRQGPIFIAGLAYSGKTPLARMLSRHPEITISRHTRLWLRFDGRFGDLRRPENLERCLAVLLADRHVRALGPDVDRLRREFRDRPPTYAALFALFYEHHLERSGKSRWGEQCGFVESIADVVLGSLPDAKMIHMVRDPRSAYELARSRTRSRRGKLGWATARWIASAELAQRNQRHYEDRYLVVRYEALMSDPAATLCSVCAFIDEDAVPEMVQMESGTADASRSDSTTGMPHSPSRMSEGEEAFVLAHAGRHLSALGYTAPGVPTSRSAASVEWPINRATMTAWRVLHGRAILSERER